MSELREQLRAARDEHRSHRYGGDLAAELLGRQPSAAPTGSGRRSKVFRLAAVGSLITGLAAAVILWIGTRPDVTNPPTSPVVVVTTTQHVPEASVAVLDDESAPLPAELSTFPSFPDELPLVPSSESMELGSMPEMPSLDFSFADTTTPKDAT